MSRQWVRLTVLTAALVVVGCTRAGAPSAPVESPATTISASSDASQSSGGTSTAADCVTLYESIDSLDPTLENLQPVSKDVVVGTVTSKGTPFWNSPTGMGPKPGEKIGEGNEFYILTPYEVTVEEAVAGTRAPGQVTVVVEGGLIGCDKFDVSPQVTLDLKSQYVLFLKPSLAADGTGVMKQPMAFLAFSVQSDGTVATPLDGAVSIARLSSVLASGAPSTAP